MDVIKVYNSPVNLPIILLLLATTFLGGYFVKNITSPQNTQITTTASTITPTETPISPTPTNVVIVLTPTPYYFDAVKLGKEVKQVYPQYKNISDIDLGNYYYKKYKTDVVIPPSKNNSNEPVILLNPQRNSPLNCITNMVGGTAYTNCY